MSNSVIGIFYETTSGVIARSFGWNGEAPEVSYYFDAAPGGRTTLEVDFATWKLHG